MSLTRIFGIGCSSRVLRNFRILESHGGRVNDASLNYKFEPFSSKPWTPLPPSLPPSFPPSPPREGVRTLNAGEGDHTLPALSLDRPPLNAQPKNPGCGALNTANKSTRSRQNGNRTNFWVRESGKNASFGSLPTFGAQNLLAPTLQAPQGIGQGPHPS